MNPDTSNVVPLPGVVHPPLAYPVRAMSDDALAAKIRHVAPGSPEQAELLREQVRRRERNLRAASVRA